MTEILRNPIIPGFYPDPSICRVEDDYYLVCSSFELCPGIPLFHSKDLMNWEQLGNVMSKENGFDLNARFGSGGVMAPTIRWKDGTFYIIDANFGSKGNFIVTAKNPEGPWSEPIWLTDVPGIDASIFFDDDGKSYVIGTGLEAHKPDGTTGKCIWCAEFSLEEMRLASEPHAIWDSALRNAEWPEAPHIYKKDGWYYLLIAEGGTDYYHSISMARSRKIFDWYEGNQANPVLTHRHLGLSYPIANIGHGDLVELKDGRWYCVMLGSRLIEGDHKNLGRETFICPVAWENGWAVFSPGTGKVEIEYPAPLPMKGQKAVKNGKITFEEERSFDKRLCFWGVPYEDFFHVKDGGIYLRCLKRPLTRKLKEVDLSSEPVIRKDDCVSFIGIRQTSPFFSFSTIMHFSPEAVDSAGICMLQAMNHHMRTELVKDNEIQKLRLVIATTEYDKPLYFGGTAVTTEKTLIETEYRDNILVLKICGKGQEHTVYYGNSESGLVKLCHFDAGQINPPQIGGMVGTLLGVFASGNGKKSDNEAMFEWIEYIDSEY